MMHYLFICLLGFLCNFGLNINKPNLILDFYTDDVSYGFSRRHISDFLCHYKIDFNRNWNNKDNFISVVPTLF